MLYHVIARPLLTEHSAVLRTYVALGLYSNVQRAAYPSIDTIATDINMDPRSVYRAIDRLETLGLLSVIRSPGKPNHYVMLSPGDDGFLTPDTRVTGAASTPDTHVTPPLTPMSPEQDGLNKKKESSSAEKESIRDNGRSSVGAESTTPPPTPAPQKKSTDKPMTRLAREEADSYWQEERVKHFFLEIRKLYPRTLDRGQEMEAFRKTVGAKIVQHPDLDTQIWNGLHAWIAYWQKEGTETRFIPHFSTWINGERWDAKPTGVTT
jgi:hypothetical protein